MYVRFYVGFTFGCLPGVSGLDCLGGGVRMGAEEEEGGGGFIPRAA